MLCQSLPLWEPGEYQGADPAFHPTLDTYVLSGEKVRGAIVICPGGGYCFTSDREAEPIATQFAAAGYHAFVVNYSVAPNRYPQALFDLTRAVCIVREHAEEWRVDPERIMVGGFSAGGHLAASLGVFWNRPFLQTLPRMQPGKNRPNALMLAYPVITSGEWAHTGSFDTLLGSCEDSPLRREMALETQVGSHTPPAFLWHTFDDGGVPVQNSLLFASALAAHSVPFELHIYPHGEHGLSLATKEVCEEESPHVATWVGLCLRWMRWVFGDSKD